MGRSEQVERMFKRKSRDGGEIEGVEGGDW